MWVEKKKKPPHTQHLKIKSINTPAHFLSLSIQNSLTTMYVSGEVTMLCVDKQDDDNERKSSQFSHVYDLSL